MSSSFSVFVFKVVTIEILAVVKQDRKQTKYIETRLMLSLVDVISRLMRSHFGIPFTTAYYIKTTGYCYHSVDNITFGLAQSDHIKRLLLYNKD